MSRYTVDITPQALQKIKGLPGHLRQRVKRAIDDLDDSPHPAESKGLEMPDALPFELCRIRLDK